MDQQQQQQQQQQRGVVSDPENENHHLSDNDNNRDENLDDNGRRRLEQQEEMEGGTNEVSANHNPNQNNVRDDRSAANQAVQHNHGAPPPYVGGQQQGGSPFGNHHHHVPFGQQHQHGGPPPPPFPHPGFGWPPQPPSQQPSSTVMQQYQPPSLLQYYEEQMRAAAGSYAMAAMAAAQIASEMAVASSSSANTAMNNSTSTGGSQNNNFPPCLPMFPPTLSLPVPPPRHHQQPPMYGQQQQQQPQPHLTAGVPVPNQPHFYNHDPSPAMPHHLSDSFSRSNHPPAAFQYHPDDSTAGSFLTEPDESSQQQQQYYGNHRRKRQQRMPPQHHHRYGYGGGDGDGGGPNSRNDMNDSSNYNNNHGGNEKRGRRRRRFRNNDGSSDEYRRPRVHRKMTAFSTTTSGTSDGGGSAASSTSKVHNKKKQRQPNDESLLGKTGVSALYEWCGKRRTNPEFSFVTTPPGGGGASPEASSVVEQQQQQPPTHQTLSNNNGQDFEYTVRIDGMECGKGRGQTKTAAKQMCARRALQVLLPGVVFEEGSGILIELPQTQLQQKNKRSIDQSIRNLAISQHNTHNNSAVASSLEDLAPNLAKRLAIGHPNDDDLDNGNDEDSNINGHRKKKGTILYKGSTSSKSSSRVKLPAVYPGTSTTSDDEDDNAYYASRGASICSALLHAMVQIDDRIPEAPSYTYQVSTVPAPTNSTKVAVATGINSNRSETASDTIATTTSQLKRKADGPNSSSFSPSPPIVIHRGSFTCVATMKLLVEDPKNPDVAQYQILQDKGVGCTKREARHTASARLLALLFPECDDLVQVKQAAEAARERYAASKALKQKYQREAKKSFVLGRPSSHQSKYGADDDDEYGDDDNGVENICGIESPPTDLTFALAKTTTAATTDDDDEQNDDNNVLSIPAAIKQRILFAIEPSLVVPDGDGQGKDDFNGEVVAAEEEEEAAAQARQISRRNQLNDRIDKALQKLNEHDEEGRSLPDELTADDVGRTVLRRASPEDLDWIAKLLGKGESLLSLPPSPISILGPSATETVGATCTKGSSSQSSSSARGISQLSQANRLWSSSTIVLLLCRAIAPHEDPPLGCAALNLGFSMEKGRELRIAQLASEQHLPRERFIECLQSFASCFGCNLETSSSQRPPNFICLAERECHRIISSHLGVSILKGDKTTQQTNIHSGPKMAASAQEQHQHHLPCAGPLVVATSALQSVQEENEEIEESDSCPEHMAEKRIAAKKGQDKPSKRSRVQ